MLMTRWPVLGAGKVSADFNGDGFDDLAVLASTSYDEVQDRDSFATVTTLYGSADGLTTTGRQRVTGRDMPDADSQSFAFNPSAVVAGDLKGDGASELVLGWNSAAVGSVPVAGAVYVIPGSPSGLRLGATQVWSQARAGVRVRPRSVIFRFRVGRRRFRCWSRGRSGHRRAEGTDRIAIPIRPGHGSGAVRPRAG